MTDASEHPAPQLSAEEQAVLEKLRQGAARRRELLEKGDGRKVANPDKYAFPIGVDDGGRPFEPGPGEAAPPPTSSPGSGSDP